MASRGSFPHPVIDHSDDVDSVFEPLDLKINATQEEVCVSFEARTDDAELLDMIAAGTARYSFRWTCSRTISTGEQEPELVKRTASGVILQTWISQQLIAGDVFVEVRVIAAAAIPELFWTRQHADYGGATFRLEKGDVIAEGGVFEFNAEKLYDPFERPVGSCFVIRPDPKLRTGMKVGLDGADEVVVRLPTEVCNSLGNLSRFRFGPDLQISMIILPALMETIVFLQRNHESQDEDLADRRWATALLNMIDRVGNIEDSALTLAQKLLENPVDRTLLAGINVEVEDE